MPTRGVQGANRGLQVAKKDRKQEMVDDHRTSGPGGGGGRSSCSMLLRESGVLLGRGG